MKIFLSFVSENRPIAEKIHLALLGDNHEVFFDQSNLPAGSDYNSRIRDAIAECELFIFLISPHSCGTGRYAHSELKLAKQKWPKPWGFVLPVMVEETEYTLIDSYLASVTLLEPIGNIEIEVMSAIEKIPSHPVDAISTSEKEIASSLLTFLEDRRLITEESGYQSHFPDPLRESAKEIRQRTNEALQKISRESVLVPALRRIQNAARSFQETTEGALDGHRMGGGMTPYLPMGLTPFLQSLEKYRQEIATSMIEFANLSDLEIDPRVLLVFRNGQKHLKSLAKSFE